MVTISYLRKSKTKLYLVAYKYRVGKSCIVRHAVRRIKASNKDSAANTIQKFHMYKVKPFDLKVTEIKESEK